MSSVKGLPAVDYTFAFRDADISQAAEEILGTTLGLTYTLDPEVTGKMTFTIERRLTQRQLLEAFEEALKSEGVVMIRQGDSLLLAPRAKAKTFASLTAGDPDSGHGIGYETMAVPLKYATPSEVAKALQSLSRQDVVVFVDDKQGLLILGGDRAELDAAVQTVRTFDHSGLEQTKIRFFQLNQEPADTITEELNQVLKASGVTGVTVVGLKRLNGLFVFARNNSTLDQVADWISKFDVPSHDTTNGFYVYHPRNVAAQDLSTSLIGVLTGRQVATTPPQPALSTASGLSTTSMTSGGLGGMSATGNGYAGGASSLIGQAPTSPRPPPAQSAGGGSSGGLLGGDNNGPGSQAHVTFDRGSNTVLIMAPPALWIQIQKVLEEIDRAPAQVLVEASILEVTLNNQFDFGVDWSVVGANGNLGVQSINSPSGGVGANTPGFAITYMHNNLKAALNALAAKTTVEVVSNPKIIALDTPSAQLQVGDEVPIISQTGQSTVSSGAPIVNSVSYLDTGVILNVTPRVSGDRIYLDIDQEVSDTTSTSSSSINSPTVEQRRLQTSLVLPDGGLVALGGLISENRTSTDSGMPWVKDIPGLGMLLKTTTKSKTRTELVVLLTAKIIRDKAGEDHVLSDLLADMKEIDRLGLLKR